MPNTLGTPAITKILHTEADKTTIEAVVGGSGLTIKEGQPVKLAADGTVILWAPADGIDALLGYAYQAATVTGNVLTIFTRGYMILNTLSAAALNAGPAKYSALDSATGYTQYVAATVGTDAVNGWVLDQAAGASVVVRVLLKD